MVVCGPLLLAYRQTACGLVYKIVDAFHAGMQLVNSIHDSHLTDVLCEAAEGIPLQWVGVSQDASSVVCLEIYWTEQTLHCLRRRRDAVSACVCVSRAKQALLTLSLHRVVESCS